MRFLPYVRFLTEDDASWQIIRPKMEHYWGNRYDVLASLSSEDSEVVRAMINFGSDRIIACYKTVRSTLNVILAATYGCSNIKEYPITNQSPEFRIMGVSSNTNPADIDNLITDILIVRLLQSAHPRIPIDFMTNCVTSAILSEPPGTHTQMHLARGILLRRVPFLQHPEGPELDGIDRLRENEFIASFRQKVVDEAYEKEPKQVNELVKRVEQEYEDYRNRVLTQHHRDARIGKSIIRNAISLLVGLIAPGLVEGSSVLRDAKATRMGWTAFVASAENSPHDKNRSKNS